MTQITKQREKKKFHNRISNQMAMAIAINKQRKIKNVTCSCIERKCHHYYRTILTSFIH